MSLITDETIGEGGTHRFNDEMPAGLSGTGRRRAPWGAPGPVASGPAAPQDANASYKADPDGDDRAVATPVIVCPTVRQSASQGIVAAEDSPAELQPAISTEIRHGTSNLSM